MLPTSEGVEPATSWSPVGWRIQLSHRATNTVSVWTDLLQYTVLALREVRESETPKHCSGTSKNQCQSDGASNRATETGLEGVENRGLWSRFSTPPTGPGEWECVKNHVWSLYWVILNMEGWLWNALCNEMPYSHELNFAFKPKTLWSIGSPYHSATWTFLYSWGVSRQMLFSFWSTKTLLTLVMLNKFHAF